VEHCGWYNWNKGWSKIILEAKPMIRENAFLSGMVIGKSTEFVLIPVEAIQDAAMAEQNLVDLQRELHELDEESNEAFIESYDRYFLRNSGISTEEEDHESEED